MTFVSPPATQQVVVAPNSAAAEKIPLTSSVSIQAAQTGTPFVSTIYPGIGFEVRIFDVLNPNGTPIAYIPNPQTISFEDVLSDVGSWQVTLATDDAPATVFNKDNIWKIYWQGIEVFASGSMQMQDVQIQDSGQHDRTILGNGAGQVLNWAQTYPKNWFLGLGVDGHGGGIVPTQNFANISHAGVVQQLVLQAQHRGTIPFVTLYNWGATKDTSGQVWPDVNNLLVDAGQTVLKVLGDYASATPFDWHMDTKFRLSLWNHAGINRAVQIKAVPVGSIVSAEITSDWTSLADVILIENANQTFVEQDDATSITAYGRREFFASSSTVIDQTGSEDLGLSLLNEFKSPAVQKVVQIDSDAPGAPQPYIDYFLGDIIGVEFIDGSISNARVIGIAMNNAGGATSSISLGNNVGVNNAVIQVTLDFILTQTSSQIAGTSSTSIDTSGTGDQVVYTDNSGTTNTVTPSPIVFLTLQIEAFTDTYAEVQTFIYGNASAALTLTLDVYLDTNIVRTIKQQLPAGNSTWSPRFMISALPNGTHTSWLRLAASTGTFTVNGGDMQYWFEGPNLNGGVGGVSPLIDIADTISDAFIYPVVTDHLLSTAVQTPAHLTPTLEILPYTAITDTADGVQNTLWQGYIVKVAAGADDGNTSSVPSFTTSGTQLEVGNDGGLVWSSFARFVLPSGIPSGATITRSFLSGTVDQTDSGALITVQAEHAAAPTAPTSRADYLGRTLTTATVSWTPGSIVSGTVIQSPSLNSIIQELVTAFPGTITAISIFWQDASSPTNGKMLIRSFDNVANQPPQLTVYWHI